MLGAACRFHDKPYAHYPHDPDSQTEMTSYWLSTLWSMSRQALWGPLGFDFWANLEPLPWAHELVDLLAEKVGMENICILTSPIKTDGCVQGKRYYIKKHFPQFEEQSLIGRPKHFCAGPTHALIDDHDGNIKRFAKAGGQTFLFPAPYNERFKEHPIPALKKWLDEQTYA